MGDQKRQEDPVIVVLILLLGLHIIIIIIYPHIIIILYPHIIIVMMGQFLLYLLRLLHLQHLLMGCEILELPKKFNLKLDDKGRFPPHLPPKNNGS